MIQKDFLKKVFNTSSVYDEIINHIKQFENIKNIKSYIMNIIKHQMTIKEIDSQKLQLYIKITQYLYNDNYKIKVFYNIFKTLNKKEENKIILINYFNNNIDEKLINFYKKKIVNEKKKNIKEIDKIIKIYLIKENIYEKIKIKNREINKI